MKLITKSKEPNSLTKHRANRPGANFDNILLVDKNELRGSLLAEQGHICCYCMKRIVVNANNDGSSSYQMKVEHYKCQENYPELQLIYTNLFGACMGNEGHPGKLQTCDTKKAYFDLTINPLSLSPNCESLFKYNAEGEISSVNNDNEINRQINEILNLNMQTLKDGRREVYLEVQKRVEAESRKLTQKQLKLKFFEQERVQWLTKKDGKYRPYCMVAVYYLTKKIRQHHS
ncbi:retron system putative HNH endonuclease [Chitinophaga sp. CF418]|uniref:retron system putative HNH endonuclease n=1 Tax=Chitinophaga sp. CF418 TaxID=1855287 RepID=UPI00091A8D7C|nr:retron system putative HNH endonuclease [Chitinophaga sp. CF418]SHN45729.1 TIGR02646 family protein [Chitinophaga sp. CF418]